MLLHLSAAFNTLDHRILLDRLSRTFGVGGTALEWFASYIISRTQSLVINGISSSPLPLSCNVPQGSVLGPILFTLYTQALSGIINRHNCNYQKLVDDTQLHDAFQPALFPSLITSLQACFEEIKAWMLNNTLKLNDDRTEAIKIGSRASLSLAQAQSIVVGGNCIPFCLCVKDLGVYLDTIPSMHEHISFLCH